MRRVQSIDISTVTSIVDTVGSDRNRKRTEPTIKLSKPKGVHSRKSKQTTRKTKPIDCGEQCVQSGDVTNIVLDGISTCDSLLTGLTGVSAGNWKSSLLYGTVFYRLVRSIQNNILIEINNPMLERIVIKDRGV